MLPLEEELAFFQQLVFPPGYEWLRDLYACEISQHSHEKDAVSEHAAAAASIGLHDNSNVLACQAQHAYNCNQFQAAHDLSQRMLNRSSCARDVLRLDPCQGLWRKTRITTASSRYTYAHWSSSNGRATCFTAPISLWNRIRTRPSRGLLSRAIIT